MIRMLWVSSSLLWAIVGDLQMVHSFTATTQYNRGSLGLKSRGGSYTGNTHLYSTETQVIPLQEGICKTIMKQGNGKAVRAGEIATVKYTCSALTDDETEGPFATGDSEKMVRYIDRELTYMIGLKNMTMMMNALVLSIL
mmetsp:Transcript_4556/g.8110  ORF Transcript_4556/g.8110 Transcript_4556/m.8110 type:complete len:140 (-) Transcript_4556:1071-1490(-)